jgi:hypothetical protein
MNAINPLTTHDALWHSTIMPPERSAAHAYEIEYQGKVIRCRDLKAMKAALAELKGSKVIREGTPWTADEFKSFTARIHVPQRRLLAKLLEYGTTAWLEDVKLRADLGIPDNKSLAGTLSGISKVALMFDVDPRRVYTQKTAYQHSKPRRLYQISSAFLQAAAQYNWPSKQDLKDTL